MSTVTFQKLVVHLEKVKSIYETLHLSRKEISEIEIAIETFKKYGEISIDALVTEQQKTGKQATKKGKMSFSNTVDLLFQKKYGELSGTKLTYTELQTPQQVVDYIERSSKTTVMKDSTALDLKLLYCMLTGENLELKGTKNAVYESIKSTIRAKKRGKAFLEYV